LSTTNPLHTDLRLSDERPAIYYLIYGMARVGSSRELKEIVARCGLHFSQESELKYFIVKL
jgi:hypothetical protein